MSYLSILLLFMLAQVQKSASFDYGDALTKSLLFFEAQRSGKLPSNQRVKWRGDSALHDGQNAGMDLVGGYYDAGDNVKFGFPMAFTVTMLAWSVVEFGSELKARNELENALRCIQWGTDYFIKAHPEPQVLYGEVGEGKSDHACWQRPEDMTTPRTAYKINANHPGSDLAAETAAALAAASIAFHNSNSTYSALLLNHAKQLFEFARQHRGLYQNSIPVAGVFYSSSGYEDELLWAAVWLKGATDDNSYIDWITSTSTNSGGTREMLSWDDKYVGAQLLIAKGILEGKYKGRNGRLDGMKNNAEQYICNCIQKGSKNVQRTKGGLLWFKEWNNLQYVTTASFIITAYARTLTNTHTSIQCPAAATVGPQDLIAFARSQVDYILGSNPKQMSYMVGFGSNYPKQVHHRGASIVSIKIDSKPVGCQQGFNEWLHRNADNPNVIEGAIVGGPDQSDEYRDFRDNYEQAEPATANTAPLLGVLATLAASYN